MERGCGCNSGGSMQNACSVMLDKIRKIDFALYDTILYLDAYPYSCEAIEYYNNLKSQHDELLAKYEEACGPMTPFGNTSSNEWNWVNSPWPWFFEANK